MNKRVLIIGGAGFIGSHTADELYNKGYKIRILDNLSPKTHFGNWPDYLNPKFEKIKGDVRKKSDVLKSLASVDYVIHLAAQMDLMPNYSDFFDVNVTSTALLYELIVAYKLPIRKVIVASSQFVYGEGRWKCAIDDEVFPKLRSLSQLLKGEWDPVCPICQGKIKSMFLKETHQDPPNQYAISKYTQELITLKLGQLNNIPSVVMRYSIVHGPRQSLKNVYSGALRIFTLKMLSDDALPIYEDGNSLRDYVSVYDVARANVLVLENNGTDYQNFNVGGGEAYTVMQLANLIAKILKKKIKAKATGQFRLGDIRHAVSDITKLKKLGWKIIDTEEKIVREYINWVKSQKVKQNYLVNAEKNLKQAGVLRKAHNV